MNSDYSRWPESHRLAGVFGALVLIFCFCYFFELASFPYSLDEEWAAFRVDPSVWIGQGRWGAFLVEKYVLPQSAIPFVPQMIFGLCCAAAFLMILRTVGRDILALSLWDYASFVIFCAFPTWFFIVEFSSNIGAVGLGLLCGTAAVHIAVATSGENWRSARALLAFLAAGLLGGFAVATYQTLLFYIFCLCAGTVLAKALWGDGKLTMIYAARVFAVLVGSAIFYFLVSAIFKYSYQVAETYTNVFFNTDYFFGDPVGAVIKSLKEVAGYYGVSDSVYHGPTWALPVLLAAGLLTLTFDGRHNASTRLLLIAGGVALLAAPFALNPFFPGFVLGRTMVATAVAAWFLCYLGLNSQRRWIRSLTHVALVVAIAQIVVVQNKSQASSYFLAKHDLLVATSIYDRLGNAPGFRKGVQYPTAVFGGRNFKSAYAVPATSNAAASFFGPYNGNTQRVRAYMRSLGLEGLRPVTDQELDGVVVRLSQMPIWPAAGSVALENGMLLVRLGRVPGPTEAESLRRVGAPIPQ